MTCCAPVPDNSNKGVANFLLHVLVPPQSELKHNPNCDCTAVRWQRRKGQMMQVNRFSSTSIMALFVCYCFFGFLLLFSPMP
mmetsp:Transcript_26254/g.53292  ORF Transcript_26254/g.53292 Transcript_26254/m.53292 type:complete len:82 (-) Transcript_26254:218-463(-)